jgi:hypothetical protein
MASTAPARASSIIRCHFGRGGPYRLALTSFSLSTGSMSVSPVVPRLFVSSAVDLRRVRCLLVPADAGVTDGPSAVLNVHVRHPTRDNPETQQGGVDFLGWS